MRRTLGSANLSREAASKERGAGAMDQKILLYVSHTKYVCIMTNYAKDDKA